MEKPADDADTTTASSGKSDDDTNNKKTVGEELFLVHLSRFEKEERSPDDFDVSTERSHQPEQSVGEELWRVHCKRSEGAEEEDEDAEQDTKLPAKAKASPKRKTASDTSRIMMLRNRRVRVRFD